MPVPDKIKAPFNSFKKLFKKKSKAPEAEANGEAATSKEEGEAAAPTENGKPDETQAPAAEAQVNGDQPAEAQQNGDAPKSEENGETAATDEPASEK